MTARDNQAATNSPHEPGRPLSGQPIDARTHRAEVLAERIRQLIDAAPPLSPEQIERLRGLLPAPTPQPSSSTPGPLTASGLSPFAAPHPAP